MTNRFYVWISVFIMFMMSIFLYISTLRGNLGNPESTSDLNSLNAETLPFESSHERAPYAEMLSIKNKRTIELGHDLALFGSPDVGYSGYKYYSFFPSGVSYSILGAYLIGSWFNMGQLAAFFTSSLFSILTMIFIYLIVVQVLKRQNWAGMLAAITYAFATISWSYSITIYQHSSAALFVVFLLYCAWRFREAAHHWTLWIWASLFWTMLGIALFFDYPNAFLLTPICIYFLISAFSSEKLKTRINVTLKSSFITTSILFISLVALNLGRNFYYFGSYTSFGNSLPRFTQAIDQARSYSVPLIGSKNLTAASPSASDYSGVFQEENVPKSIKVLLFGIDKGLLLFSPILLLGLIGVFTSLKKRSTEIGVAIATIAMNFFVYSSFSDPWGGWAYGPRYLIPMMPFLSIFAVLWLSTNRFKWLKKTLYFVLFSTSSAIALAGPLTTNLIPPKVEADYLKIPFYNFMRAFDLLSKEKTGNFIYNTFLRSTMSLYDYFFIIWGFLQIVAIVLLFVVPLFEKNHES